MVYSHKTHEKCADILLQRLSNIKLWQIILSAITTGGFLSTFFGSGNVGAGIGVVVSTFLLVLNAYTKNYDLGELAQKHRSAAADLWMIREGYLSLITDLRAGTRKQDDIVAGRDGLLKELHAVYTGAPSTTFEAYKKAQQALQTAEDLTFSDEELDAFLPNALKKANRVHATD